jgi:hypothetical protein
MRNIVKRIVSAGAAAVIGVGMLVGCSSDGKSGSDSSGKDGNMKIGVCIWSTDVGRILRTFKIKKNVEVTDNGKIII